MSGRLILEYREGGRVTRIEREVRHGSYNWTDAERDDLRNALSAASAEMLDAAMPKGVTPDAS